MSYKYPHLVTFLKNQSYIKSISSVFYVATNIIFIQWSSLLCTVKREYKKRKKKTDHPLNSARWLPTQDKSRTRSTYFRTVLLCSLQSVSYQKPPTCEKEWQLLYICGKISPLWEVNIVKAKLWRRAKRNTCRLSRLYLKQCIDK